jgi:hypothetical protein
MAYVIFNKKIKNIFFFTDAINHAPQVFLRAFLGAGARFENYFATVLQRYRNGILS